MNLLFRSLLLLALSVTALSAEVVLTPREWTVDGVKREASIYVPPQAKDSATPVIFAFHGHGGRIASAARSMPFPDLWPEALVVYMQGLNTPGRLTDPEGKKPGWQSAVGVQGDRDLKFFDAVLASLKAEYKVDLSRIYSTGHSNGGGFTYLLWAARGDIFAAMAPSASAATRTKSELKPKPVMHLAGENDPLVKFEWQKATIDALLILNQCGKGTAWDQDENCTFYPSSTGTPVVTALHPGGHEYRPESAGLIVKFFKQHAKKTP